MRKQEEMLHYGGEQLVPTTNVSPSLHDPAVPLSGDAMHLRVADGALTMFWGFVVFAALY